ncbi:helix-turn-helix domain-containing protein [Saccharolobus caldissimus]|uniref:Transcription regulator TrmB N-terminal domain-containing protein n=1 Tax=Saccharolobus caldissimus TaxID=1702097 RepID=A0AAQ4CSM3_9CREN|nr:helix-turn-helix domain-containing protein [Saccharolobus caldissimus]BDB98804.1 hypothetical protein SACC_18210 [Saccharolobus caldissimus]
MQSQTENQITLPDGRVVNILDVVGFLYGLTGRDIEVLKLLIKSAQPLTMEDISKKLGITKSVVNKSILNLEKKGIIIKEKIETSKKGRRAYAYKADFQALSKKVVNDLDQFMKNIKSKIVIVTGMKIEKSNKS